MGKVTTKLVWDEQLRARFKAQCALEGTNMTDKIIELVTEWLAEKEKPSK